MKKEHERRTFCEWSKPDEELRKIIKYASRGKVLDIGAGEGRNSIFLAKNGFEVEAIDVVAKGLQKCKMVARKHNLSIKTKIADVRKFEFKKENYSLIISINALDFLKLREIRTIINKISYSLLLDGIFYLYGFSTKDPLYRMCRKKKLKEVEKNTFYLPKFKTFRHFFNKTELLSLCKNFGMIKIEQQKITHTHNDKTHSHYIIKLITRKKRNVENIPLLEDAPCI